MSNATAELAVQERPFIKASTQLSHFLGIETGMMIDTLKAQCFKGKKPEEVTDEQLASFVSVCNVLQLNPLLPGMVYAYPERNGSITPIVGPDGTMKKLDEFISAGKLMGYDCEVFPVDATLAPTHAVATIYRAGDQKPAKYTAYFKEWNVSQNPNWSARPRHMIFIRALKQCARQVIHGLPMDDDEYKIAQMTNVTGTGEDHQAGALSEAAKTPRPKVERKKGGAALAQDAKPAEPSIETTATEVAQTPDAPAAAEPSAEPVAEKVSAPIRTALNAEEKASFEGCTVVEVVAKNFNPDPAKTPMLFVKAKIKGPFTGDVFDSAIKFKDPAKPEAGLEFSSAWKAGQSINVVLNGVARRDGSVGAKVQSVESVEEQIP